MNSHMEIDVSSRPAGPAQLIDVNGEIDLYTSNVVQDCLETLIDQGHSRLIVDLDGVSYLDSTGLGLLMKAALKLQETGGRLAILCANTKVLRVLGLLGLTESLPVYATEDEAVASFASSAPQA